MTSLGRELDGPIPDWIVCSIIPLAADSPSGEFCTTTWHPPVSSALSVMLCVMRCNLFLISLFTSAMLGSWPDFNTTFVYPSC